MPFDLDSQASPAPDARARLHAAVAELGPDELAVLALIAERLAAGRRVYGELELETDTRDFGQEALEEAADMSVYAAAGLLRARRRARAEQPEQQ